MSSARTISLLAVLLTVLGLIMVGNASGVNAIRDFQDQWYYLRQQGLWSLIGLAVFVLLARLDHRRWERLASPAYLVTLVLLIVVLIPGIGLKLLGARRWINLGFFSLQPAELAKISLAIYFSALLKRHSHLLAFFLPLGLICGLVMLEPDLGTTLAIFGMSTLLFFVASPQSWKLLFFLPVLGLMFFSLIIISPYRAARLQAFMNFSQDPSGASYHIRQAVIGFGSGGLFGVGLGQSRQKYEYLPEVTTDSIFAIIGEEMGFFGALAIILIYLLLILQGFEVAIHTQEIFSRNLAVALTGLLAIQTCINLSSITALLPFTGIPLTFLSYGGSALVVSLMAAGLLVNIAHTNSS